MESQNSASRQLLPLTSKYLKKVPFRIDNIAVLFRMHEKNEIHLL